METKWILKFEIIIDVFAASVEYLCYGATAIIIDLNLSERGSFLYTYVRI